MRGTLAIIVTLMLAYLAPNASESSSSPPNRSLTEEEVLLNSSEWSDAVVVARYSSAGDAHTGGQYTIVRRLKGGGDVAAGRRIGILHGESGNPGDAYLIYLRRAKTSDARGARESWFALDSKYIHGRGMFRVDADQVGPEEAAARRAIRMIEPESLATLSSIVVLAEFSRASACGDKDQYSTCFLVKEQLYGEPVARSIHVMSAVPGYLQEGEQLLYLKLVALARFEPIGLSAGAQRVKDSRVGTGRRPLDRVRQLLRNADLARRQRSPI